MRVAIVSIILFLLANAAHAQYKGGKGDGYDAARISRIIASVKDVRKPEIRIMKQERYCIGFFYFKGMKAFVNVLDATGRTVYVHEAGIDSDHSLIQLELPPLMAGIYLVAVTTQDAVFSEKLIVY